MSVILALTLLASCGGDPSPNSTAPLSANNLNLVFVASPDLVYQAPGDINPSTANLTDQGLQRSLLMATYLKQQVLGTKNVTGIYTLEPMTHLQTTPTYADIPDMTAVGFIQQFALLNQITLPINSTGSTYTANSFPLYAAYATGSVPSGVVTPNPFIPGAQGLDFNDTGGDNEALVTSLVKANVPGFYVFSAPWETISTLMKNIAKINGYNLNLSTTYMGPNYVYAISIPSSGSASLVTYNSNLNPPATYPVLPAPVASTSCTAQAPFSITVTSGSNGAIIPAGINTNETIYMIRHAEAHPDANNSFEDGNYVGAGQWRALDLPNALRGKISPNMIYSIDPAQSFTLGNISFSYVRPSLTVLPYAIANNLPYYLVSDFGIAAQNSPQLTSEFFFNGGNFTGQSVLLAWEHNHFPLIINALLASYFPNGGGPTAPAWPSTDYDTIWSVTLDAKGDLTVNNSMCEGIDSAALPVTAPLF
jgi:hypothetical protein